jgi:hypothetical protein
LIGTVEWAPGIPYTGGCKVLLEGTPLAASCDASGQYDVRKVPAGRWDLRIVLPSTVTSAATLRIQAGSNPGSVTSVPTVDIGNLGAIAGKVTMQGLDIESAVVGISELHIYVHPSSGGGYLLTGVPPGRHPVDLFVHGRVATERLATVDAAGDLTQDIILGPPVSPSVANPSAASPFAKH